MKPFVFKAFGQWVAVGKLPDGRPLAPAKSWTDAMEAALGGPLVSEATA